jgi:hypothetical protein
MRQTIKKLKAKLARLEKWFEGALLRTEYPVAGIPQAGHDVTVIIQLAINRGGVDGHIRMGRPQRCHALWGC